MAKRQPSKQQPLKKDLCPVCRKDFGNYSAGENAQPAVYIGMADEWLHSGCYKEYYKTIAEEQS